MFYLLCRYNLCRGEEKYMNCKPNNNTMKITKIMFINFVKQPGIIQRVCP